MTEITVVEFESATFGNSYVSELEDGPPYTVHGIALGSGDVTVGASGIKKKWPAEELERAADSLRGTNLVVDHNNDATGVVGRVTKSGYKEGTGVVYEAELYDEDLAEKVKNGLLEVSIRGYHADVDSLEEDTETGAKVVEDIKFDNLSIVPTGAAPSNTLEMGAHAELSAAELSAFVDTLESVELETDEIEPGMWVQWGDKHGITISPVEDGEIEVDVYKESGDKWRSAGETETVSAGDLSEWDVDEDDIGAAEEEDDDSGEDEESEDEEEEQDEEENEAVERGQFVKWRDHDSNWKHGQIIGIKQEGQQHVANIRHFTQDGDKLEDVSKKPLQGLDKWDGHPRTSEDGEGRMDDDAVDAPDWQEGQMVQWQVNPEMMGEIVHVDNEKDIVMVEVMEEEGGEVKSSGFTITAGFSDLEPADGEMAGMTTGDMPAQDAKPDHEPMGERPTLMDLFKEFMNQFSGEQANLSEFADWLETEELYNIERGEGEEEPLNSQAKKENSEEGEPHRFPDAEPESGEELEEEEEDMDNEEELALEDVPMDHRFSTKEKAMDAIKDMEGVEGVHRMGSVWVPGETHEEYMDNIAQAGTHPDDMEEESGDEEEEDEEDEEEEASADEGDESDVEELQSTHEPEWSDTADQEWNKPALNDFTEDSWGDMSKEQRNEIANHFLVSKTGFPPENFTDLALPVVEPDGTLNLNALANAKARAGQVKGLGGDTLEEVENMIDKLANDNFEDASFGEEEEEAESNDAEAHEIGGTSGRPTAAKTVGGVRVLSGDDLQSGSNGASESDSLTQLKVNTMDSNIEEKLSELDEPVAVEAAEVEELRDKANRFEEMSENLEALRERTDILDSVDREQVEELAESEDAVVVESDRYEELQDEAAQVKGVYAAALAEEYPAFDAEELTESFSIEQLREKFEEHIGDVEEELTATSQDAEPRSQDATEEELEEKAEESSEDASEEELSDEVARKQEELKNKILNR